MRSESMSLRVKEQRGQRRVEGLGAGPAAPIRAVKGQRERGA